MDAKTFFGYTTGSSMYDSRRHVNMLCDAFLEYNLKLTRGQRVHVIKQVLDTRETNESLAAKIMMQNLLSPMQVNFLRYFKDKYSLSDDEFTTILSGVSCTSKEIRSPAGYSKQDNIVLLSQMVMATAYMVQENEFIQQYYDKLERIAQSFPEKINYGEFVKIIGYVCGLCDSYGNNMLANYEKIEAMIRDKYK